MIDVSRKYAIQAAIVRLVYPLCDYENVGLTAVSQHHENTEGNDNPGVGTAGDLTDLASIFTFDHRYTKGGRCTLATYIPFSPISAGDQFTATEGVY